MENSRKHIRIPMASVAHITPHGIQRAVDVFVRDISTFGMGGYMNCGYEKGQILLVKLKISTSNDELIEESIMGRIQWSKKLDKKEKYAFGLEFHDMEKNHPKLYLYLRELEDTLFPNP